MYFQNTYQDAYQDIKNTLKYLQNIYQNIALYIFSEFLNFFLEIRPKNIKTLSHHLKTCAFLSNPEFFLQNKSAPPGPTALHTLVCVDVCWRLVTPQEHPYVAVFWRLGTPRKYLYVGVFWRLGATGQIEQSLQSKSLAEKEVQRDMKIKSQRGTAGCGRRLDEDQ